MARNVVVTDEQIIQALDANYGMVYRAARALKVKPPTIYNHAKANPEIEKRMRANRKELCDLAESKLVDALNIGESWSIAFTLKTLGKDRGYIEKQEIDNSGETTNIVKIDLSGLSYEQLRAIGEGLKD
jgi:hypothetical protein